MVFPVDQLRRLPADPAHRLRARYFCLPPGRLPNGQPRPPRVIAEASFLLGDAFNLIARVLSPDRPGGPTRLVLVEEYDLLRHRRVPLPDDPSLAASAYWMMAALCVQARARMHAAGRGRN